MHNLKWTLFGSRNKETQFTLFSKLTKLSLALSLSLPLELQKSTGTRHASCAINVGCPWWTSHSDRRPNASTVVTVMIANLRRAATSVTSHSRPEWRRWSKYFHHQTQMIRWSEVSQLITTPSFSQIQGTPVAWAVLLLCGLQESNWHQIVHSSWKRHVSDFWLVSGLSESESQIEKISKTKSNERNSHRYCTGCYEEKFATRCIKCNQVSHWKG